jgi:hypothetical protein
MPRLKIESRVTTTVSNFRVEITSAELIAYARSIHPIIPENARAYVTVPGGGDWSNSDIEFPTIIIDWQTVTESK